MVGCSTACSVPAVVLAVVVVIRAVTHVLQLQHAVHPQLAVVTLDAPSALPVEHPQLAVAILVVTRAVADAAEVASVAVVCFPVSSPRNTVEAAIADVTLVASLPVVLLLLADASLLVAYLLHAVAIPAVTQVAVVAVAVAYWVSSSAVAVRAAVVATADVTLVANLLAARLRPAVVLILAVEQVALRTEFPCSQHQLLPLRTQLRQFHLHP